MGSMTNICIFIIYILIIRVSHEMENKERVWTWPVGTYGLLEPQSECPRSGSWKNGFVYMNTEDDMNTNSHSAIFHVKGRFNDQGIEMRFCIKAEAHPHDRNTSVIQWPTGNYCIFKYRNCPRGFRIGRVFWHNEKNTEQVPSHYGGTIPDGVYNATSTLMEFCCMKKNDLDEPIELPSRDPFYLFPSQARCQEVKNMKVTLEWIHFDDEDEGNTDFTEGLVPYGIDPTKDYNIIFRLCYYTPKDEFTSSEIALGAKQESANTISTEKSKKIIIGAVITGSSLFLIGIALYLIVKCKKT